MYYRCLRRLDDGSLAKRAAVKRNYLEQIRDEAYYECPFSPWKISGPRWTQAMAKDLFKQSCFCRSIEAPPPGKSSKGGQSRFWRRPCMLSTPAVPFNATNPLELFAGKMRALTPHLVDGERGNTFPFDFSRWFSFSTSVATLTASLVSKLSIFLTLFCVCIENPVRNTIESVRILKLFLTL